MTRDKVMLAIIFTPTKRFNVAAFPAGVSMNSEAYVEFLRDTGEKFRRLHSSPIHLSEIYLQHDNARAHVAQNTMTFINNSGITLVKQSSYSPDMNICDRWLNSSLKDHLRQTKTSGSEDVVHATLQFLRDIPEEDYFEQVRKLKRHCERVIEAAGEYITD